MKEIFLYELSMMFRWPPCSVQMFIETLIVLPLTGLVLLLNALIRPSHDRFHCFSQQPLLHPFLECCFVCSTNTFCVCVRSELFNNVFLIKQRITIKTTACSVYPVKETRHSLRVAMGSSVSRETNNLRSGSRSRVYWAIP